MREQAAQPPVPNGARSIPMQVHLPAHPAAQSLSLSNPCTPRCSLDGTAPDQQQQQQAVLRSAASVIESGALTQESSGGHGVQHSLSFPSMPVMVRPGNAACLSGRGCIAAGLLAPACCISWVIGP